jgi:hypothetical protein
MLRPVRGRSRSLNDSGLELAPRQQEEIAVSALLVVYR